MKTKLFGTVCVLSALALVACGDDESGEGGSGGSPTTATNGTGTGSTKTATGTTTTKTSSTATGTAECPLPDTTNATTCEEACPALYDCGALECNGAPICAFTGMQAEKDAFVATCLETCAGMMALIQVIDEMDCQATVDTISAVSADFAMSCENGIMP
ncbi:MAG: hypothetical protein HOV80_27645 [Polyangiaceae bacterium]|nr:hypothetical protein [Polyangiaceae bacterium]